MYYGRKKGIIIAIVVAVIVILLIVGGIFTYMFTDLFKSEKTLFWKYMESGIGSTKTLENTQLEDVEKLKQQSPYKVQGELTGSSTDEQTNTILQKLKLTLDGQTDKINNYSHVASKVQYANATIFNLDYVNNDETYALKSDQIVTVYLGVKNENLKVLFQKLGVEDTTSIPNEITPINYMDILKFSDEELKHIKETYTSVLIDSIPDNNYSKQTEAVIEKDGVSYNTTSYRLDLTGVQITEILTKLLNTLKTDSITLNLITTKAKALGMGEEYTTIENLNNEIDSMINNIQETEFTDTSFVVYSYKGETIATEIIVKNTQKATIYNTDKNIKVLLENLMSDEEYNTMSIELTYNTTTTQSVINAKLNIDNEQEISLDITNNGSASQGNLSTVYNLAITNQGETIELAYNQTLEFINQIEDMQKLDETNCAILNDYPQEQLGTLIEAVVSQATNVFLQNYIQIFGMNFIGNDPAMQ